MTQSMLAVAIVAVTGQNLPPNAFARIATWSHGQASVDTGDRSKWGPDNAEPAILPIIVAGGLDKAVVELEVSLWDRSSEVSWMFDAVAEVSLPPPKDLGTCQQQAINRTFPLETDDVQVGTLSLCAWIISQQLELNMQYSSASAIATSCVPVDAGGVSWSGIDMGMGLSGNCSGGTSSDNGNGNNTTQDADDDQRGSKERSDDSDKDDALFEISMSTGSVASTPRTLFDQPQRCDGTSTPPGQLQHTRHSINHQPGSITTQTKTNGGCSGASAVEAAGRRQEYTRQTFTNLRQANRTDSSTTEDSAASRPDSPAAQASARHCTVQSPPPPQQGPRSACCTIEQHLGSMVCGADADAALCTPAVENDFDDPPLDLEAAMLPLIPSYAAGSAEIRVWANRIIIPSAHAKNTTSPYVRCSLHPGRAQVMARTPAYRQSNTVKKSMSDLALCAVDIGHAFAPASASEENVSWPPSGEPTVEYAFGTTAEEESDSRQGLALPIGPDMTTMMAGGHGPPTLRLEVVSGRSLGHCDVSLVEALRHPGRAFRELTIPIWRKESSTTETARGRAGMSGGTEGDNAGRGRELMATLAERQSIVCFVEFDFGVMLVGAPPDDIVGLESDKLVLTKSLITVEIMGLRESGTAGGSDLDLRDIKKRSGIVGVGVELVLSGGTKVAAFDAIDSNAHEGEGHEEAQTMVVTESKNGGSAALTSLCTELEALDLYFVRETLVLVGDLSHRSRGCGVREVGRRLKGHSVTIPVSDINDIFDGRTWWLAMDSTTGENRRKQAVGRTTGETTERASGRWEVQLKLTVSNTVPVGHLHRWTPITSKGNQDSTRSTTQKAPPILVTGASCINQSLILHSATMPKFAELCPAFQHGHFTEARATVSSLVGAGEHRASDDEATSKGSEVKRRDPPAPGHLELTVSAIHGVWREATVPKNDCEGCGGRVAAEPSPWRVLVNFSGGSKGDASISFNQMVLEGASGERQAIVQDRWGDGGNGCVRWPLDTSGVRAGYEIHWTPRQNVLPTASFDVSRGQVLVAQSVCEVAPMVVHPGETFSFLHPCWARAHACFHPWEQLFLEVECVFFLEGTSSERRVRTDRRKFGQRVPRSLLTPANGDGVLCIQVIDIRRLHREVRSTLALPFTVAFSLPRHESIYWSRCCAHCIELAERGGVVAGSIPCNEGTGRGIGRGGVASPLGDGAGNLALLNIEPRRRGSLMILASLLVDGEDNRKNQSDADNPVTYPSGDCGNCCNRQRQTSNNQQQVVGTTWLPVSDDVMTKGRSFDSWYPLRMGRSSTRVDRACEVRLRIHYLPNLQRAFEKSMTLTSSFREDDAPRVTLVLEEGRDLTHPDLQAGPRELFAEASIRCGDINNEEAGSLADERAACCIAWLAERVVGPLPIREAANVYGYGNGASPRWNYLFQVPLPVAMLDAYLSNRVDSEKAAPLLGTPLLTIVIKSAARRVVDPFPSNRQSSWSRGAAGGRVVERCLVLGTARIRLPPSLFWPEKHSKREPIRGWYGIKGDDHGALRGKVRVAVYPMSWSSNSGIKCSMQRGNSGSRPRCTQGNQTKTARSTVDQSVLPNTKEALSSDGGHVAVDEGEYSAGCTTWSDSSGTSGEADEAATQLKRAGGGGGQSLHGRGLLLVSVSDLEVRFSGGKQKTDDSFTLAESSVSIRHASSAPHPSSEVKMEACLSPEENGEEHISVSSCVRGLSATLAVEHYAPGKHPVLYVRVSITAGPKPPTDYHGAVDFVSCLSSIGLPVQARKGLMKIRGRRSIDGGPEDGGSCSSENTRGDISGSEIGGGCRRDSAEVVTVNITTTFVPHMSGVLNVYLPKLRLTPPCPEDLALLRTLTELRAQPCSSRAENLRGKDAVAGVGLFTHQGDTSHGQAKVGNDIDGRRESSSAFLRVRVLPSGPWACSPLFDVMWPRPADWGREPTTAGVTSLPEGEAAMTLKIDTSIHTISRGIPARSTDNASTPVANASTATLSNCSTVKALALEVCMFDNSKHVSSCGLLGRGTLPLAPWIVAGRHRRYPNHEGGHPVEGEQWSTPPTAREVVLLEPATGKDIARVVLRMQFAHNRTAVDADSRLPTENQGATAAKPQDASSERIRKVSDTSLLVWCLKAIFHPLDPDHTGWVRLDVLIEAAGKAKWPGNNLIARTTDEMGVRGSENPLRRVSMIDSLSTVRWGKGGHAGSSRGLKREGFVQLTRGLLGILTDGFVSWELWAAFVEVICQAPDGVHVTSTLVWQRAIELGHQRDGFAGVRQHHAHPNIDINAEELRQIADRMDAFIDGYGDVSRCVNSHTSLQDSPTTSHLTAAITAKNACATAQNLRGRRDTATMTCLTKKSQTAPINKMRGVNQALQRSQRVWPRQRQTLPDQSNHLNRRFPQYGVSASSSSCGILRTSSRRDNKGHRQTVRSATSAPVLTCSKPTPSASRRPASTDLGRSQGHSEGVGSGEAGGGQPDNGDNGLTQQGKGAAEDFGIWMRSTEQQRAWLRAQRDARSDSRVEKVVRGGFTGSPTVVAEHRPDQEQLLGTRCGTSEEPTAQELTEVRLGEARMAAAGAIELETSWREMRSAKRKASKYKTGMLEAQSALENERKRMLLLEARTLETEGRLLQRDRDRIRQTARARARLFALDVEKARRKERLTAKQARTTVEATAASILQNIGKGYLERLRYKLELDRIKALQRACRYMVEAMRSRHWRNRRNEAAVSAQRIWRGRFVRGQLAAHSALATKIQAFVRGALQRETIRDQLQAYLRCRIQGAIVLQTSRRRLLSRRVYLALRLATVRVQVCHRRRLARQELAARRNAVTVLQRAARRYVFILSRQRAAAVIEASYRALLRVRKARKERKEILAAAGVLQLAVRGWLARRRLRWMLEARQRERAAAKIQTWLRRYRLKRELYRRRLAAAITLQQVIGKFSVKLSRLRKRKQQEAAAKKIQQLTRGYILKQKNYRRRLAAAITLQQGIGKFSVNLSRFRRRRRQQEVEVAVTVLQSAYRGHRTRQNTAATLAKRHYAAAKLQAFFVRNCQRDVSTRGDSDPRRQEQSELVRQKATRGARNRSKRSHTSQAHESIAPPILASQRMEEQEKTEAGQQWLEREQLQSAVQAVAGSMARTGAILAVDARVLQDLSARDVDDPALEKEFRRSIISLDGAIGFSKLSVRCPAKITETTDAAIWVADDLEEAVSRALMVLERGLPPSK